MFINIIINKILNTHAYSLQLYKEGGSFQREYDKFRKQRETTVERQCSTKVNTKENSEVVEIQDVFFPFQLLFVGIILGNLILMFEKMYLILKHKHNDI